MHIDKGAIHKQRLLKEGGRGVKNVGIYLVKRQQREREGVIQSENWADVVYGWPLNNIKCHLSRKEKILILFGQKCGHSGHNVLKQK